jgi:GNAT superfamily N-acetyltransferase
MIYAWRQGPYTISTDKALLKLETIQALLARSYWAADRPLELIRRSIDHSLAFGMYDGEQQIGFARLVTDYATFAYLADVIIADEYRGRGLGTWLVETMLDHPELERVRRWLLITRDAHGLYRQFGFTTLDHPERYMERIAISAAGSAEQQPA